MKKFKRILTFAAISLIATVLFADGIFLNEEIVTSLDAYTYQSQLNLPEISAGVPVDAAAQAIGSTYYPVTPGDQYTLIFYDGKTPTTEIITIGSDYSAAVASIGNFNAKGMSLTEFKRKVENLINTYYQYSIPQLTLTQCGVFNVRVAGDAKYASYVTAWGLTRLSDMAQYANVTASTREIVVISADGTKKTYDLFNGLINGNENDDPILAPGCQVIFQKASTTVSLDGAAKKTGVFQLKDGETLKNLIDSYGNGTANNADTDSFIVSNYKNGAFVSQVIPYANVDSYVLQDGDMVTVKSIARAQEYIIVSGAVASPNDESSKFFFTIAPQDTAEEAVIQIASTFLGAADPKGIYVDRDGEKIVFDAEGALAGKATTSTPLQQGDMLIVPYSQLLVTVTGGVNKPGTFAYIPDRTLDYYINMAGGYTADAKKLSKSIVDKNGDKLKHVEYIPAESTITVPVSHFRTDLSTAVTFTTLITGILSIIVTTSGLLK